MLWGWMVRMQVEGAQQAMPVLGIVQAKAVVDEVEMNLATLECLVGDAAAAGAEIVVTPELFATGYAPDRAWRHDGDRVRRALASMASRHAVALVASSVHAVADGHRIAASFFDEQGKEIARVHKRHLFGPVEKAWMRPGEGCSGLVSWRGVTWGMAVCYDVEFPELVRELAMAGAEALLVPTAVPAIEEGVKGAGDAWHYSGAQISRLQVPARALDNGLVIAYANHCGAGFTGHSVVATPFGGIAAMLGDEQGIAVVRVPDGAIARARSINTYLEDLAR